MRSGILVQVNERLDSITKRCGGMHNRYKPKKITNIVFYSLIIIVMILTIIRWISAFHSNIVVINAEINSHISNFSLSLLVYLAIGFTWMLQGAAFKKVVLSGAIIIMANLLCETVMGFMNTPDIIDAVYGIAGTLISFFFLLITKKHGLRVIHE